AGEFPAPFSFRRYREKPFADRLREGASRSEERRAGKACGGRWSRRVVKKGRAGCGCGGGRTERERDSVDCDVGGLPSSAEDREAPEADTASLTPLDQTAARGRQAWRR